MFLKENKSLIQTSDLALKYLLGLTKLCLEFYIFQFDEKIFQQIHGIAMGSRVSVALSEIVMQTAENLIIENCSHKFMLWKQYTDDIIAIIPRNEQQAIFEYINSINENIQFTSKVVSDSELRFLHLLIKEMIIVPFPFTENPQVGRSSDYQSYSNPNNLCSESEKVKELIRIRSTLSKNNFPSQLVYLFIKEPSFSNHNSNLDNPLITQST